MEIAAPPHTYGGGGGGGSAVNALMPGVNPGLMPHDTGDSVGQPGDWESLIPVWGSGRSAVDHFQRGNYWKGTGHLALAISDVFLVKSLATIAVKGTVIGATKIASKNVIAETSIITANGIEISGFAKHGLNRAIERGVKPHAILDAIKNPLKTGNIITDQLGRQSQRFIGRYGEIVVNPQTGQIISINPTSSRKAAKLLKQLGQ